MKAAEDVLVALGTKIRNRTRQRLDAFRAVGHQINVSRVMDEALNAKMDAIEFPDRPPPDALIAEELRTTLREIAGLARSHER